MADRFRALAAKTAARPAAPAPVAAVPPPPPLPPAPPAATAAVEPALEVPVALPRFEPVEPPLVPVLPTSDIWAAEARDAPVRPSPPEPPDWSEPPPEPIKPAPMPDLLASLSERLPATSLLLKPRNREAPDPFVRPAQFSSAPGPQPQPVEPVSPAQATHAADTARALLDVMSMSSDSAQPQERALAADTLLQLAPRLPIRTLVSVAERLSMMEQPPTLLLNRLIGNPNPEVAAPLLERCTGVSDDDLRRVVASGDVLKQKMIARRRVLSSALGDALVAQGDPSVILTVVRNPGAVLSHAAFVHLSALAPMNPALQAPLATRADTPQPVAFELFWTLPPELRRYVLSRFLTDSMTLDRILKIALAAEGGEAAGEGGEQRFAERSRVEELARLIEGGERQAAVTTLGELASVCLATAERIICDPGGEPLVIAFKALGAARGVFGAAVERWRTSPGASLRSDRNIAELQNMFDSLSFNKARVLLTYWDWASLGTGPYAYRSA